MQPDSKKFAKQGIVLRRADSHALWSLLFKQTLFQLEESSLAGKSPLYFIIDGLDKVDNPTLFLSFLFELPLSS